MPGEDSLWRRAGEGRFAGQHLVEDAAQRIQVGAAVNRILPAGLLRTHVARCPHRDPGRGQLLAPRRGDRPRDAEIGHERMAA